MHQNVTQTLHYDTAFWNFFQGYYKIDLESCVALICINMTSRISMCFSSFFSCLNSLYSPLLSSLPRRHFPFSCILPHTWEQQTVVLWRLKNSEQEMLRFKGEKKIMPVKTQLFCTKEACFCVAWGDDRRVCSDTEDFYFIWRKYEWSCPENCHGSGELCVVAKKLLCSLNFKFISVSTSSNIFLSKPY